MAVDQNHLDDIAAHVAELYREAETALTRQIADRLSKDMDHPYAETKLVAVRALQRSARTILATLNNKASDTIRDAIATAIRDGYGSALEDLPKAWFPKSGIGQEAQTARDAVPNTAAIESVAAALLADIGEKSRNVLRDVLDAYRAVQTAAAARVLTGVQTRRQASQAAWQRLVDRGITGFVDKAGRRWRLSSYVEMAVRTNAQRAAVQAQTDRLTSLGVPLVYVSNAPQECRFCRPYEGKILSLDGRAGKRTVPHHVTDEPIVVDVTATLPDAMRGGLLHPNCRHSVAGYLPGVTRLPDGPTEDPEGNKARRRQRAIEREIRKHKERSLAALTPEAKKQAQAKVRQWQAALRDHLDAHPSLKRLRYREQIGAGNIPGPGGPDGGPTGQIEPPVQPTLDDGPTPEPKSKPQPAPPRADGTPAPGQQNPLDLPADKPKPPATQPAPKKTKPKPTAKPKPEPAPPQTHGMKNGVRHHDNAEAVRWADEHLPLPGDLTDDERHALKIYSNSTYRPINDGLRAGRIDEERIQQNIDHMDAAFRRTAGKTPPMLLHRGVERQFVEHLGADLDIPESMRSLIGKVFREDGYMSTSAGAEAVYHGDVYLVIRVPHGYQALNLMSLSTSGPGEREILLRRGARYVVHDVYRRGPEWFMEVEIVPDDWTPPPGWTPDPYGDVDAGYQ